MSDADGGRTSDEAAIWSSAPAPQSAVSKCRPTTRLHHRARPRAPRVAYAWLAADAARVGCTQRYSWEPWHYGLPFARLLTVMGGRPLTVPRSRGMRWQAVRRTCYRGSCIAKPHTPDRHNSAARCSTACVGDRLCAAPRGASSAMPESGVKCGTLPLTGPFGRRSVLDGLPGAHDDDRLATDAPIGDRHGTHRSSAPGGTWTTRPES
jgi:hypothetical protein